MDTKIRTLLQAAQKYGVDEGGTALQQSYELLRNVAETRPSVDTPDAFSQDLYVICAETAFQHGKPELARECLKMYFMKTPPNNQFLCRAYLCQAQLLAPTSADNPDQLEKAVVYLIKAINMSKENQRYHFLVYNASVLYWQFCRPFLKPNYRQYLARSLHQVVKALDDIEDKDYEWRAQLMIALIECHMDAGRKSDASHIATAAASFIKQYVPNLYKTVFGLLVRHQLVDVTRLQKEIKASSELNVYYKICRLKLAIEQKDPDKDIGDEMRQLVSQISGQGTREVTFSGKDRDRSRTPDDRRSPSRQLSRQSPTQGKKQPLLDTPENAPLVEIPPISMPHLLLELGRLALEQNLPDVAQQCVNLIKDVAHLVKDPSFFLQVEFMQSELMVRSLGNKQEHYTKPVVDIRLQAIKRCDEAIINALRQSNPSVLQAGCVTQWNLCLALLQTNLRHHVRRPLTTVADALHSIQSLLVQLRCQVHMELAKCEEDVEQIEVAMDHLKKALALDDGNVYNERLIVALHRLELRAELYTQPERPEDQAAMIIEQARKADSGTIRMKRSLLVRAGQALAPDAFLLVLESESDTKEKNRSEVSSGKGPLTQMRKLAGKAQQYNKCVKKAAGHLRRLGDENDRERAKLWADLAKTARKQEVWDVCRIACRFCLLYDDGRWKNEPLKTEGTPRQGSQSMAEDVPIRERSSLGKVSVKDKESKETVASRPASPEPTVPLYDKDLIRTIAEVNFINGESMIHLVRSEGVELGNKPIPPEDKSKRPKGYVAKKPEEDPDWLEYCEWIASLCDAAINSFLRGVELGIELQEAWIMCCAAAYIWNYNNHILSENRHSQIVEILQKVLDGLKQVGHAGETALLVNISNGLAIGLMQPWLPAATPRDVIMPSPPPGPRPGGDKSPTRGSAKRRGAAPQPAKSKPTLQVSISSEATPDIKRALEVCEYAMSVTNGDNPEDVVPIAVRLPLLQTWVRAKQMMQSQINRNFGIEEEGSQEGQNPMTQAMVTVEMLSSNNNGILEFKECPTLIQTVEMVEACKWTDRLIELQLWTKLTFLGFEAKDHAIVVKCAMKALQFAESSTQPRKRSDPHKYIVEQEMLSYASSIYGQSLVENAHGKNSARRQAMVQFLDSARFACNANNGDLVMTAARHYWNAALPLISQPIERELLQRPLSTLLQCITDTTDKKKYKRDEGSDEEDEDKKPMKQASIGGIPPVDPSGEAGQGSAGKPSAVGIIGGPEDDLTLRASLYGVLFQSYADKGEWEAGLRAMDQAIADMPRTNHRLLIFKHMVMTKAKLGLNVHMSIHKFKIEFDPPDESEDYVAHMWRRVALASRDTQEQLQAYQNAIEALTSADSEWLKYEYLLEFGQWMYCNEFPLQDVLNQIQWGADILLNMKFEVEQKKEAPTKSKKGKGKKDRTSSPPPTGGRGKKGSVSKRPDPSDTKKPVDEAKKIEAEKEIKPDDAESINAADYVPVKKDIIIGVAPVNLGLTFAELCNIQQLDGLFRSHILMAQISGRASHNFADYCLMAYGFIMRMWQVSMPASGPVVKELAKNPPPEPAHGKSSAKGTKGKKDKSAELIKDKPKRKGPLDALPSSTEEWAGYDIPDEVLEAFKQDAMKTSGINAHSIPKPALTFYYLHLLTNELRKLGYNHLALPVLAMADALARALIKDRSLIALVHIRSLEVCLELNLLNGANFHEKLSEFKINEEDQAKCREEIVIWKEKQVQVAKEEVRIREAMAKYAGSAAKRSQAATSRQKAGGSTKPEESTEGVAIHLGKVIGAVQMRDVWASTAELLINHGLYQPAREMLNEAHLAAQAFDDKDLVVRVLHQLAKLAYLEAQYGQTVNLCTQAQRQHSGDEEFWYNTTMLMVDATLADYELKNRHKQARGILQNALNVFAEVAEMRPTKQSINGFILAKLEAKLGSVMVAVANEEKSHASKPKTVSALLTACKHLRHGEEQLLKLGYEREALHIYKERAAVLWQMAQEADTEAEKHDLFIQALAVYGEACSLADQLMYDIHTLVSIQDLDAVSLPIDREYAEIKLLCCELMNDMLCQHVDEVKASGAAKLRKGSIVRAVEELVVETPNYTPVEREWIDTTKVLGERIMVMLTTIHSLTSPIPQLRARILYNIGRCMRLLSVEKDPDQQIIWNMQEMNMLNMAQQIQDKGGNNEENEPEEGGHPEENPPPSRQSTKYSTLLCKLKGDLSLSHQYLVQATECLTQAVNLALSKALTKTAGLAALELVDCIGQLDPGLATQYLALYQSCASSQYLEGLMMKALVDPTLSQQAALFHQKKNLMANDVSSNASRGPVLRTLLASINDNSQSHAEKDESTSPNRIPTEAWRRLMVTPNHLDILKEFPPNFNFVILQHSPDRKYLYGAVLDKPRAADRAAGGGKSQKKDMLQASSKSKVVRVETKPEILDDILSRFKLFKHDVMQLLLRKEYVTSQQAQRDKMLANIQSQEKTIEQLEVDAEMQEEEDRLHEVFCCILQDMEMYLQPVTALLETALRPASATTVSNDRRGGEPLAPQEYVVLLADALLMELPLEALVGLQSESIVSLSREVSLQMLHHKMNTELSDESSEKTKKDKEKSKPPSRIPGLRDASKKQSKIIPLDRPVPGSCLPVDTHAFRYMVDPCLDCSETEEKAPIEVFNVMLEEHSQQFTPRWLGVMGNEHTPSAGEYEIYVMESSAFAFYGMERFMCYLPPHKVAALNLTDCQMVMLFDMAQTNKSFYRQSKIDVLKTEDMLSLEKPVETALLLALTGIKSVCLNQWHCTLAENADKINVFMKDLLASGLTNGQTVRLLQTPYRRKIPEEESPEDNADSQSNKADEKPEKGSVHADTEGGDIQSEAGAAPEEPLPEPVPTRTWYNMVVYGVPNLMITQLSKQ